jgi:hypothetical protein
MTDVYVDIVDAWLKKVILLLFSPANVTDTTQLLSAFHMRNSSEVWTG